MPGSQTAPAPVQCLVNQQHKWSRNEGSITISGSSMLWLPNFAGGGNPGWSSDTQTPRFWVLSRSAPLATPQSFVASDATTVPDGLAALMDSQHILVAAVLADSWRVPQGPLYDFLMANGAGTALATVERLNAGMACGLQCMFAYVLVSVPGGGEAPGIEFLDMPAPITAAVGPQGTFISIGVSLAAFELVPEDDGSYFPARSIYQTAM